MFRFVQRCERRRDGKLTGGPCTQGVTCPIKKADCDNRWVNTISHQIGLIRNQFSAGGSPAEVHLTLVSSNGLTRRIEETQVNHTITFADGHSVPGGYGNIARVVSDHTFKRQRVHQFAINQELRFQVRWM